MTEIILDGFKFTFESGVTAYIFDDFKNKKSKYYHGASMLRPVDILIELPNIDLFIELKKYPDISIFQNANSNSSSSQNELISLKNNLKFKFRDTFLYRCAEGKSSKPIMCVTLINELKSAERILLEDLLKIELPVGIPEGVPNGRWQFPLFDEFYVVDTEIWNNFSIFMSRVELV